MSNNRPTSLVKLEVSKAKVFNAKKRHFDGESGSWKTVLEFYEAHGSYYEFMVVTERD